MSWVVLLPCVLVAAACGSSASQAGRQGANPTPLPSAGTVSATISGLGQNDQYDNVLAADDTAVWVHNGAAGVLVRVDPRTNAVVATIPVGHGEGGVALGDGAVWVVNPVEGTVVRVDPQTNQVVASIPWGLAHAVASITTSQGAVWLTDFINDRLIRIDPQTNQIVAKIANTPGITGISYGAGSVWACNHHSATQGVVRVDLATNQVLAQLNPAGDQGYCSSVVALGQTIWTTSFFNDEPSSVKLERLDPATNTVKAIISAPNGVAPFHFAANEQGVWLYGDTGVYRVDPATNRVVGMVAISGIDGVAVGAGSVWGARSDGTLLRITPAS
jgi:DNA-binding beta-propeller fold protein YncE